MSVTIASMTGFARRQGSVEDFLWAWERGDESEAWRESMGWDCVFLANLLL